jgi:glycosyltransferase involved in cell wall biosynthesis
MGGGGAERQLAYLAGALPEHGWEPYVALLRGGINMERLQQSGVSIRRIDAGHAFAPRALLDLRRLIKELQPDVVQTWLAHMDITAGTAATLRRVPWILSERSSSAAYLPAYQRAMRRMLAKRAAAVVANSSAGALQWRGLGAALPRFVVHNAIPFDEIAAAALANLDRYRRSTDTRIVLAVGRLNDAEGKNWPTLVDALVRAAKECDVVALICGTGPDESRMRAAIAAAGMEERIVLAGFVTDIWSWMRAADLFVSLSRWEGLPNAVMEAAACGMPLLLSDIPAHRELVDGETAWLIEPDDSAGVARAIVAAFADDDERRRRGAAAMSAARQWSIPAMAAQYAAIYEQILARN